MFVFESIDAFETYGEVAPEVQGNFSAYVVYNGIVDRSTTFFVRDNYPLSKEW